MALELSVCTRDLRCQLLPVVHVATLTDWASAPYVGEEASKGMKLASEAKIGLGAGHGGQDVPDCPHPTASA